MKLQAMNLKPADGLQLVVAAPLIEAWAKAPQAKKSTEPTVLDLFGPVADYGPDFISAVNLSAMLKKVDPKADITVRLSSPGGVIDEGVAVYNLLLGHKGQVTVQVIGMAASIASVIAMAADKIEVNESAKIMIHSSWSCACGNAEEMRQYAAILDSYDDAISDLYAARTGRSKADVLAMMKKETWFSATQALDNGFADAVIKNKAKSEPKDEAKTTSMMEAFTRQFAGAFAMNRAGGASPLETPASGGSRPNLSGAPGKKGKAVSSVIKGTDMKKSTQEQIASFEAKRAANVARMEAIMELSGTEERSLTEVEEEEYNNLAAEVTTVDKHLTRLKEHQKLMLTKATPVAGTSDDDATQSRSGVITVRNNLPKGTAFTRYAMALARSKGNIMQAIQIAQRWKDTTPQVITALQAAVDPGNTTSADWAGPLINIEQMASEFIELLRPQTIVGRIGNFRRVPFNVKMPRQLTGSSVGWVGQAEPKKVGKLTFDTVTLGFAKCAGIVVITDELARLSNPSAEAVVQGDMLEVVAQFMDQQFIDPDVVALANVSPASVTNGVTPRVSTGYTVAAVQNDVKNVMGNFITANINLASGVWIMHPRTALALSMLRSTTEDTFAFPTITPQGGTFFGLPVITSANVPVDVSTASEQETIIVLANANDILMADDGGIALDVSREASLQMDSAPETGAMSLVSLWQNNLVGIRAERAINWLKRRSAAVQVISEVTY